MPSIAQATAKSLAEIGFARLSPEDGPMGSGVPTPGAPLRRGVTAPIGNAPNLGTTPSAGLPRTRVAAVPPLSDAAFMGSGGSTTVVSTSSVSASGSGGSTVVTNSTTLTASNTAVTTPPLSQTEFFTCPVQTGRTFVLFRVAVSAPARVQLYSSAAAQLADTGRPTTTAPTYGAATGLICDLDLEGTQEAAWVCTPVIVGANAEQPRGPSAYLTVTNPVAATNPITVSLFFLPLES